MNRRMHLPSSSPLAVGDDVRQKSRMQADHARIAAQKRAITQACLRRQLAPPIFFEDERSTRYESAPGGSR
jgi:hypothetical protein